MNKAILNSETASFDSKTLLVVLLISGAFILRIIYLGYSTLYHGEAEYAQNVAYLLPCLSEYSYLEAMWRLWHIFIINLNALYTTLFPLNISLAWFFGLNEFTIRLNAPFGGVISALLIYILVKRHSDRNTALIALSLITFNVYLIFFNRFAYPDSIQVAITLLGVVFIDSYCRNRKFLFLFLSSICFGVSFLIRFNAICFIPIILFLYFQYFGLKIRDIVYVTVTSSIFIIILFFDQLDVFIPSIWEAKKFVNADVGIESYIFEKTVSIVNDTLQLIKFNVSFFEVSALPLVISIAFWRKIDNRFFKLLIIFSILYFVVFILQGRPFYRYLQIGVIAISAAFSFVIIKYASRQYYYGGIAFLVVLLTWSLFAHRSYYSAQYHHIPYKYIKMRVNEVREDGRILLYGRNSETEYYLSSTGNLWHDQSINPCTELVTRPSEFHHQPGYVHKVEPTYKTLLDSEIVRADDIVVVSGWHMTGGEPKPHRYGYDGREFRVYRHNLSMPNEVYNEYSINVELNNKFDVIEKIYLTNGSDKLAALILKRI